MLRTLRVVRSSVVLRSRRISTLSSASSDDEGESSVDEKTSKASKSKSRTDATTPMMKQYLQIKAAYPEHIVLFRMGDFYEMFFEDAIKASEALDIVLAKRGKYKNREVPLAGIPHHALDTYLERLIRKNMTAVICEQTETVEQAKKRKSLILRREVTRVITPGTLLEERLLDPRANHYLAGVMVGESGAMGLAWLDLSTGVFRLAPTSLASLPADLSRIQAKEVVFPSKIPLIEELKRLKQYHVSVFETLNQIEPRWSASLADQRQQVGSEWVAQFLQDEPAPELLSDFTRLEVQAASMLLKYVAQTQQGRLPRIQKPARFLLSSSLVMDSSTRKSLELMTSINGDRKGSLLAVLDEAVTSAGARLLQSRLQAPSTSLSSIQMRLDLIELFFRHPQLTDDLRQLLKRCSDIERCFQRLSLSRGGPRDLVSIRDSLKEAGLLTKLFGPRANTEPIRSVLSGLGDFSAICDHLLRALIPSPPLSASDGNFIAPGYMPELDRLKLLRDNGEKLVVGLQTQYRTESGVPTLKIRHNRMLGYFIEVSSRYGEQISRLPGFIKRQSLMDKHRFSTKELEAFEKDIADAASGALEQELIIFDKLCDEVFQKTSAILEVARILAELDVASSLSVLALKRNYCRPVMTSGLDFHIVDGRHAVVDVAQTERGHHFVANTCRLEEKYGRTWMLTGPNMGGKSTFLRQNALIAIMAHMGSFVPAASAHIGIIDQLFSRVGASDDLVNDRSTFMVEMQETAAILNNATSRSLVIMDEIGRGTSTFDGTALAWASLRHLHLINRARAIFATHYHQVAMMAEQLSHVRSYKMDIQTDQVENDGFIYTYSISPGRANRSYGIQVARLAGLPTEVIEEATRTLQQLEQNQVPQQLQIPSHDQLQHVVELVMSKAADDLRPKEALDFVYNVQKHILENKLT